MTAPWDLTPPDARECFARLGDGVLAVLSPQPAGARAMPHGGAWIHVGGDGAIRAFTGKVEVGQGTRPALALLVAEELRVPLASVTLVMGDTDVCPWDIGTFGSLAMPMAGELLRAASAGLRELLVTLAATRLGVDRERLVVADGCIAVRDGDRSVGYGALVTGMRHIETITQSQPTPPEQWARAGRPIPSLDARAVVTGALEFVTDVRLPGMWHGKILHPSAYGAKLRAIDLGVARALPEVVVVHAGALIAVAAPSPAQAGAALHAIAAQWDVSPQASELDVAEYLRAHPSEGEGFWAAMHHETGDVESALAAARLRLDASYATAYIAHAPLECRCAVAEWRGDRVVVHAGTQTPFMMRRELAEALGIDEARVQILVPPVGGGFGGKHAADVAITAAQLARASGRPVRVAFSREEEFTHAYLRPMAIIDVRAGLDSTGMLTAWDFRDVNAGANAAMTPYRVAHQRIDYQPAESPLPQGSYRALAATANNFARESHMDELATRIGADPVAFRLRHLADERLADVLRAVAAQAGWERRAREPNRGFGVACGLEKGGRVATFVEIRVGGDGRLEIVRVVTGFECGAIVHPDNLRNQVEGATIMGLGGALFEEIHFAAGRLLNPRLSQYRVPRFSDVPAIEVMLLDRRDLPSSGGGETPIIAVAPAVANAIADATGRRLRTLPLAPDGRYGAAAPAP